MKMPTLNPWSLFGLPVVAIILGVCAVIDPGAYDLNDTTILAKTCQEYPRGTAPADCPTSQDQLTNKGDEQLIENPYFAGVAVVVFVVWLAIVIKDLRKPVVAKPAAVRKPYPPPPDKDAFALLTLQPSPILPDWLAGRVLTVLLVAAALVSVILLLKWWRKRKRQK